MKKIITATFLVGTCYAGGASETHDGFIFRYVLGVGNTSGEVSGEGAKIELTGMGTSNSILFGGSINPNLALGFELVAGNSENLDVTATNADGQSADLPSSGAKIVNFVMGPNITYFIMPENIYLTGTVGVGQGQSSNSKYSTVGTSDLGIGFNLGVGKEWFVSENWGLGVSANIVSVSADSKDDCPTCKYSGTSYSINFTATFN